MFLWLNSSFVMKKFSMDLDIEDMFTSIEKYSLKVRNSRRQCQFVSHIFIENHQILLIQSLIKMKVLQY